MRSPCLFEREGRHAISKAIMYATTLTTSYKDVLFVAKERDRCEGAITRYIVRKYCFTTEYDFAVPLSHI